MLKIAICDDNTELCKNLREQLLEMFEAGVTVIVYKSIPELMTDYEKGKERNVADILLMDIDVDGENGIEAVEELQKHYSQLKVIFITAHIDYSVDIFRVNPSHLLLKPIEPERLKEALEKVQHQLKDEEQECYVVSFKGNLFKLRARDILYFESEKRTVILHARNDSWTIYRKLDEVQQELPEYFLRCHQSYLVNMNEIRCMKPLKIELYNGEEIPISRPKYKETKEQFLAYLGQS